MTATSEIGKRPSSGIPSEEPGRWLETDNRFGIEARIRGLSSVGECLDWGTYERARDDRDWVLSALRNRIDELGDRDE